MEQVTLNLFIRLLFVFYFVLMNASISRSLVVLKENLCGEYLFFYQFKEKNTFFVRDDYIRKTIIVDICNNKT